MGRLVVDERLGELGRITEVMSGPANDVWVVDGERGETLIPVVEEMIVDFEPGDSPIGVSIPAGLAPWDTGEGRN